MTAARRFRRHAPLLILIVLAIGWLVIPPRASGAPTDTSSTATLGSVFSLSGRADAVGEDIVGSGLPVLPGGDVGFASLASAQATLGPTTSAAFASAPYPGDFVVALPSTINGLGAGNLPPAPPFPFYVASIDPDTPSAHEQVGPYDIVATSSPSSSTADAAIGIATGSPQVISATADASVSANADGSFETVATTAIEPFALNSLLSIGEIRSSATLTYRPGSTLVTKETSFSVGTITIAGIQVGLTADGLTAAGKTLLPVDLSALEQLLAPTGVSIEYVPPIATPTSVSSAALEIIFNKTLPAPFMKTTVEFALGRVSATLAPGVAGTGGGVEPSNGGGPSLPGSSTIGSTTGGPSPAILGGSSPAVTSGGVPLPLTSPAPAGVTTVPLPVQTVGPLRLADFTDLYPLLAVGAAVALLGSRAVQWLTLRRRLDQT